MPKPDFAACTRELWRVQPGRLSRTNVTRHPATFTEANAWVHLAPDQFTRDFPEISTVWQTEDERVWVETDGVLSSGKADLAWWELQEKQRGEPVLPCGCRVHVHYVPHAGETICSLRNPDIGFYRRLRISGLLRLAANAACSVTHSDGSRGRPAALRRRALALQRKSHRRDLAVVREPSHHEAGPVGVFHLTL